MKRVTRKNLPVLAKESGCFVESRGTSIFIRKGSVSVVIYESGTIVRGDVDLSIVKAMTVKEATQSLKIKID